VRNAIKVLVVLSFFLVGLVLTAAVDTIFVPNGVTGKLDLVWSGAGAFSNSTTENLIPTDNITFNLGNTTNWWKLLYVQNILNSDFVNATTFYQTGRRVLDTGDNTTLSTSLATKLNVSNAKMDDSINFT